MNQARLIGCKRRTDIINHETSLYSRDNCILILENHGLSFKRS